MSSSMQCLKAGNLVGKEATFHEMFLSIPTSLSMRSSNRTSDYKLI